MGYCDINAKVSVMTVEIKEFADFVVSYCNSMGEPITNKKLQKLLYYVQAWHLAYFDEPLFDEAPEAWVHGPVFPSVYYKYKDFSYNPIGVDGEDDLCKKDFDERLEILKLSDEQSKLVYSVINKYGSMSAMKLEILTHSEAPWCDARNGLQDWEPSAKPISNESMREYYGKRLKK